MFLSGIGLLAAALGLAPQASAAPPSIAAHLAVESPRLVYTDHTETAQFTLTGLPCLAGGRAIVVRTGRCPQQAEAVTGTLATAGLGFDATRTADSGDRPVPALDTSSATADELTVQISVLVRTAGDFTVTASSEPTDQVTPRFVAGSASGGGVVTEEDVTWDLGPLAPGVHEMTVRVQPGAKAPFEGGYLPQVVIERTADTTDLLPSVRGAAAEVADAVDQTATLTLLQRVTPPSGAPQLTIGDSRPTSVQTSLQAGSWAGGMTANFQGGWRADRDPQAESATAWTFEQLGLSISKPCRGFTYSYLTPTVHDTIEASIDHPAFEERFDVRVATSPLTDAPGEAFDGEAATIAYVLDVDSSIGGDPLIPANDDGTPTLLWDGSYADAAWVHHTRASEATELGAIDGVPLGITTFGAVRHGLLSLASLTMEVRGGDVDNRASTQPRTGPVVRLAAPDGYGIGAVTTLSGYCGPGGGYRPMTAFERADDTPLSPAVAAAITPTVPEGEYWIEASGPADERSWQASTDVVLDLYPLSESAASGDVQHVVTVPRDGVTVVTHTTADRTFSSTLRTGTWRVRTSSSGILARRAN